MAFGETGGNSATRPQWPKPKGANHEQQFEWQKHQANERIQEYRKEAASHRLAKEGNGRKPGNLLVVLAMLAGFFFMIWLTVGCTSDVSLAADAPEPQSSAWVMAERIDFQDKREAYLGAETAVDANVGWTMAQRIHFQDAREAYLDRRTGVTAVTEMTMAERILGWWAPPIVRP